jgi:hypothetical protein
MPEERFEPRVGTSGEDVVGRPLLFDIAIIEEKNLVGHIAPRSSFRG